MIYRDNAKKIYAPISGKVIELEEVPDDIFSQKLVGDGVAIDSIGNEIVAPYDGILTTVFDSNHAFGMLLEDKVELIVHIGLDTIELNGEGFERIAREGQFIKVGEPIIKINREFILNKGYSLITPVIICNPKEIKNIEILIGKEVKASKDIIINYYL